MSRIDALVRRFRNIAQPKAHERVLTRTSKLEVMTATQAVRFRQIKGSRAGAANKQASERAKPHYPLPEACRRLDVPANRLLQAGAAGKLACYVLAANLRGSWHDDRPNTDDAELPQYLALRPEDCRDIETWGSVNVHELLHPGASGPGSRGAGQRRFVLREPLWVDPEGLVLKHPLPTASTV